MRAEELRIGNLITTIEGTKHHNQTLEVENLIYNEVDLDKPLVSINGYLESEVKPIPLTEEWLLKFGFGKRAMSFDIELNDHTLLQLSICNDKGKGEYYAMIRQEDEMTSIPKRIFYVHEMQNLFNVLTGKELECQTT